MRFTRPSSPALSRTRAGFFRRPTWVAIEHQVLPPDAPAPGREDVRLWQLVLSSRRIPCRLRYSDAVVSVQVPAWHAQRAVDEILAWMRENPHEEPSPATLPPSVWGSPWATVAGMLLLVAFFSFTTSVVPGSGLYPERWLALGAARAMDILNGQYWRVFTALSLHADAAHMLSNAVVGGVFIVLLSRRMGSGPAWFVALGAGGLGNWLNALVQSPMHSSIGFSTAVFGAAGALAGLRMTSGGDALASMRAAVVPVAAGLGLLAMLGSGGERTDLGAHLFGFAAGVPLGALAGTVLWRLGRVPAGAGVFLGTVAALTIPLAWAYAFFS